MAHIAGTGEAEPRAGGQGLGGGESPALCRGANSPWSFGRSRPDSCIRLDVFAVQVILFGIVAAQLADAMTFAVGVSRFGIGLESNGFAGALYGLAGLGAVLAVKGGVILATIAILVTTAGSYPRLLVWGGAAATSMGILGFVTNAWSMALLG